MFELHEECIPIPPRGGGTADGGKALYPFSQMVPGGPPFDAPRDMGKASHKGGDRRLSSITSCARSWAITHCPTAKFTTRLIDENTVRCWRVK